MYVRSTISIYSFVLLNRIYIDSAIESLIKHDEIVATECREILRFFTLTTRKFDYAIPHVNLLKFAILFAMRHRREYFTEHIGWNEDNDFIGVNFVISVRCTQIVIAIFSEKYNDGYNYDAKPHIPFRIA